MNLNNLYEKSLELALKNDPRMEYLDHITDVLEAKFLYLDTAIYFNTNVEVKKLAVGIDIDSTELYYAKMNHIDAVLAHHPQGAAYLNIWKTMDIYKYSLLQIGILKTIVDSIIIDRQIEYELNALSRNYNKVVEMAKRLNVSFFNVYTPANLLANNFLVNMFKTLEDEPLSEVMKKIVEIPEYTVAANDGASPILFMSGKNNGKLGKFFVRFSGGPSKTNQSITIFKHLREVGVNTYICKNLPVEHIMEAKEHGVNVIVCPHIASDSIGMNLLLDNYLREDPEIEIIRLGGFIRVDRR